MAEDQNEAAKKALAKDREVTDQMRKQAFEKSEKSRPTPTQEENDLAALGAHITEHEDDGSGPEPHVRTRALEAKPAAGASGAYQTRAARPAPTQ